MYENTDMISLSGTAMCDEYKARRIVMILRGMKNAGLMRDEHAAMRARRDLRTSGFMSLSVHAAMIILLCLVFLHSHAICMSPGCGGNGDGLVNIDLNPFSPGLEPAAPSSPGEPLEKQIVAVPSPPPAAQPDANDTPPKPDTPPATQDPWADANSVNVAKNKATLREVDAILNTAPSAGRNQQTARLGMGLSTEGDVSAKGSGAGQASPGGYYMTIAREWIGFDGMSYWKEYHDFRREEPCKNLEETSWYSASRGGLFSKIEAHPNNTVSDSEIWNKFATTAWHLDAPRVIVIAAIYTSSNSCSNSTKVVKSSHNADVDHAAIEAVRAFISAKRLDLEPDNGIKIWGERFTIELQRLSTGQLQDEQEKLTARYRREDGKQVKANIGGGIQ